MLEALYAAKNCRTSSGLKTRLLFNFDAGTASVLDLQPFYFSFVAIHCDI